MTVREVLIKAKNAASELALLTEKQKNQALNAMADQLIANCDTILQANAEDVAIAESNGMNSVMIDRLRLTEARIKGMADGIREVAELPDPVGEVTERVERPNGLVIEKVRVPMGVVAMIYESRPNVTSDAAALALKSGNVCVLRGGKEAIHSNIAISEALREGICQSGLPSDCLQLVTDTDRSSATELMTAMCALCLAS